MKAVRLGAAGSFALALFGCLIFIIESAWAFERGWWPLGIILVALVVVYSGVAALSGLQVFVDWLFPRRKV